MISCNIKHLIERCYERGYSIEEVSDCIVSQNGDNIIVDETHPSYPKTIKPGFTPPIKNKEQPQQTKLDTPSFLEKIKNFTGSATKHIKAGMPKSSDEEIVRRYNICLGCEFLKNNSCTKCGCPINRDKRFISKLSWADQECPIGKWGKEKNNE
jgi:hypothetical protein